MAPSFSIPQELVDIVIGYLHDDTHTLLACSTVCRSWAHASRMHLLSEISFDFRHKAIDNRILSLHTTIFSYPTRQRHVQSVRIRCFLWMSTSILMKATYRILAHVLSSLQCVRHLSLQDVHWDALPDALQHALFILIQSPRLQRLDLGQFERATLLFILSRPPNLKELHFEDDDHKSMRSGSVSRPKTTKVNSLLRKFRILRLAYFGHQRKNLPTTETGRSRTRQLETLSIDMFDFNIVHDLFQPESFLDLRSLRHISITNLSYLQHAAQLLKAAAASLEHLELSTMYFDDGDEIHLRDFPCLRSLHILHPYWTRLFADHQHDHPLEELRITSGWHGRWWASDNQYDINHFFPDAHLRSLRRVEFVVDESWTDTAMEDYSASMPHLHERGILHFVHA